MVDEIRSSLYDLEAKLIVDKKGNVIGTKPRKQGPVTRPFTALSNRKTLSMDYMDPALKRRSIGQGVAAKNINVKFNRHKAGFYLSEVMPTDSTVQESHREQIGLTRE